MQKRWLLLVLMAFCAVLPGCNNPGKSEKADEKAPTEEGTPVTVTTATTGALVQYVTVTATSAFLQKNYVKANLNGYVTSVMVKPGQFVNAGQTLFTLKTKEAQVLGNTVNKLDSSFRFSGTSSIKAGGAGYISVVSHQLGDYVQDGEQLAVISDINSFAFVMNLPYELKQYVHTGDKLTLKLPDQTTQAGTVTSAMPVVDPTAQTQNIIIKVADSKLPESLIAQVDIPTVSKDRATSLPKAAVLTNDIQNEYWVMKLIDSTTAVKVPVKKGVETKDRVEILEPSFSPADKILVTGNYGLPDTAKVKVTE